MAICLDFNLCHAWKALITAERTIGLKIFLSTHFFFSRHFIRIKNSNLTDDQRRHEENINHPWLMEKWWWHIVHCTPTGHWTDRVASTFDRDTLDGHCQGKTHRWVKPYHLHSRFPWCVTWDSKNSRTYDNNQDDGGWIVREWNLTISSIDDDRGSPALLRDEQRTV